MFYQVLSVTVIVALATSERVVVNRRARQRQRLSPRTTEPPFVDSFEIASDTSDLDRRFRVQNAFSSLANSFSYGDNVSYVEQITTEQYVDRARVPRRRTQLSRGRDIDTPQPDRPASDQQQADRQRGRARLPRRRLSVNRDLERNERNIISVERDDLRPVSRVSNNNIVDISDREVTKTRSRSRSRSRSRPAYSVQQQEDVTTEYTPVRTRGRTVNRNRVTGVDTSDTRSNIDTSAARFRLDTTSEKSYSKPYDKPDQRTSSSDRGPNVIFPRKDLFPKLNKLSLTDNEVDTGVSSGSSNNYNYKINKERLKASLYKKDEDKKYVSSSRNRFELEYDNVGDNGVNNDYNDYSYTDIQSGLSDTVSVSGGDSRDLITVTHQVPTRTVFTVIERGETKSLFADVLETSLEIVNVQNLKSTQIDNSPVYYSRVETKYPTFGVTEYEYDAILPTPSLTTSVHTLNIGGRVTSVVETLETTGYSADIVTHRQTYTPPAPPHVTPTPAEGVAGVGQISQIIQNVLLNILGGGLGGGLIGGGPGPAVDGPQETRTEFITHTRTLLTTTTKTDTVLIPVNYRGTEIYQTVTEHNVVTESITDYSVQTLLNYVPASEPFYPLAPTLHRAVRIVPSENPVGNLAHLYNKVPPPIMSTSLVLETVTGVTTITTDLTTPLTVTLGAREHVTEIIEPTTTVVTTTSISTQTILTPQSPHIPSLAAQNSPIQNYAQRLQLVKTLLRLKL